MRIVEAMSGTVRVVAAALFSGGRLLAARRAVHKREAGLWELPGGKVEPGESDQTALARELREELGVEVEVGDRVADTEHEYAHGRVRVIVYRCSHVAGEPTLVDHDEVRWLGRGELDSVVWAPADDALMGVVLESWVG